MQKVTGENRKAKGVCKSVSLIHRQLTIYHSKQSHLEEQPSQCCHREYTLPCVVVEIDCHPSNPREICITKITYFLPDFDSDVH